MTCYLVSNLLATLSLKLTSSLSNLRLELKIELLIKIVCTLLSWLSAPSRVGNSWNFYRTKMTSSLLLYILSNKDMFNKVSPTFLWKTRSSRSQLLRRKSSSQNYWTFSKNVYTLNILGRAYSLIINNNTRSWNIVAGWSKYYFDFKSI